MVHLGFLLLETVLVAGLLLLLLRWRRQVGLAPLLMTLGGFQVLRVALSSPTPIDILGRVHVDPAPSVLLIATLFAVLAVYIREDAMVVREMILGLVLASLALCLVYAAFEIHLAKGIGQGTLVLPGESLVHQLAVMVAASAILLIDSVLMIVCYEVASRVLPRVFLLRLIASAIVVLTFDSLLTTAILVPGAGGFVSLLAAILSGRLLVTTILALIFAAYFRLFHRTELETELIVAERREILEVVSFRARFDRMRALVVRDPLTGLFNRGFFDEALPLELARSQRTRLPTSLLMLDLDHFKRINDRFGHPEGDRVLREVATTLTGSLRESDAACRIGGEEFAVVLPQAASAAAIQTAERIRRRLGERVAGAHPPLAGGRVTATIGIASFPAEANSAEELVRLADRRLYEGKHRGRDCIVGGRI